MWILLKVFSKILGDTAIHRLIVGGVLGLLVDRNSSYEEIKHIVDNINRKRELAHDPESLILPIWLATEMWKAPTICEFTKSFELNNDSDCSTLRDAVLHSNVSHRQIAAWLIDRLNPVLRKRISGKEETYIHDIVHLLDDFASLTTSTTTHAHAA